MNRWFTPAGWAIALSMTGLAIAQQTEGTAPVKAPGAAAATRSPATAQSEAGEPRATLAPPSSASAAPAPTTAAPGTTAPAPIAPAGSSSRTAARGAAPPAVKSGKADRLDLGTATVTGDREQPKVMYIVPWKRSDIGDLSGKPMNSLLDEALAPVDRDEFKREVAYYDAVHADAPQNGAGKSPGKQGEK